MSYLWALDLDEKDRPWQAHLIVKSEDGQFGEIRTGACGQTFTAGTHPRGWWSTEDGNLPLSGAHDIHCGREIVQPAIRDASTGG